MADFKLYILGCGSAKPSTRHLPSCQAIEHRGKLMLVDCDYNENTGELSELFDETDLDQSIDDLNDWD